MGMFYDGINNRLVFNGPNDDSGGMACAMRNATMHMSIDRDTGNVGIGTTNTATAKLTVAGGICSTANLCLTGGNRAVVVPNGYGALHAGSHEHIRFCTDKVIDVRPDTVLNIDTNVFCQAVGTGTEGVTQFFRGAVKWPNGAANSVSYTHLTLPTTPYV